MIYRSVAAEQVIDPRCDSEYLDTVRSTPSIYVFSLTYIITSPLPKTYSP